jgi:preprotein translocase subunit YajC
MSEYIPTSVLIIATVFLAGVFLAIRKDRKKKESHEKENT